MNTKKIFQIETFKPISGYTQRELEWTEPSSFNGMVRVKKYRITVEEIIEPAEVIAERLQKLWDDCDNHHQWRPLKEAAKEIGYTLQGDPGNSRKK